MDKSELREAVESAIRAGVNAANESFRAAGIDAVAYYPAAITIEEVKR